MGGTCLVVIGSVGDVLRHFSPRFANLPGRLVLEYTGPGDYNGPAGNFVVINHNIFAPQPIRGARVYYLRTPLPRGADNEAGIMRIFEKLNLAMVHGYSILLFDHTVLGGQNATWAVTARERLENVISSVGWTEEDMKRIVRQAGFRIVRMYRPPLCVMVMMELVLDPVVR